SRLYNFYIQSNTNALPVNLQIFSFNDFPVLAITVFPLNEESKKSHAYNPDKIFVLQNNRFIKMKDS
ncbi:hypothetical protein, partial [Empedobacter sp.]|uniref:hypothetical protein n=1 Tax=Empedobacter sp. TaxID=1927715 RepID=UPI00289A6DA2